MNFGKFQKKYELLDKTVFKSWKLEEQILSCCQPTPIHKLSMTSMVWNISIGQLRLAAWLYSLPAPAHLLIS